MLTIATSAYSAECKTSECGNIDSMILTVFVMRVMEVMFFLGPAGPAIVVRILSIEDGRELFGKD